MSEAPSLNPAQMAAVHHLDGPCLVLAGAGSGKTRVITHKIGRLLEAGYAPGQIAAITFTNKAAQEMRERAKELIGGKAAKNLVISTFHSLGVRLLRAEGARLGLKDKFSILGGDDVVGILKDAGGTTDVNMARRWQWTISLWKNQGLDSDQAATAALDDDERVAAVVMKRYEERLAAYQAVDFDDLIGMPHRLLQRDEECRTKWQNTLRYVLVDEYQDTNAIQYELLKSLVGERAMFTAVGDDDQSIYGWRGATIENLRRLPQEYPALKVIPLEQNYRSTGFILRAANCVIGNNPKLFDKKLWSAFGDGDPVALVECDNEEHEAERAVARINSIRSQYPDAAYKDFAILYRANHQARVFEKALRKANIPYKVSGGQSFFERTEIRDLCAWLRLLVNNDDDPAFLRAVTTPKRGIGHTTLGALGEFSGKWKVSLFEALFAESLGTAMKPAAVASLHEFGRMVNDLEYRARHTSGSEDAKALLMGWLKDIDYEKHLYEGDDSEKVAAGRWSNVMDFVDWIARRCGGEIENDGGMSFETERQTVLDVAQTISVIISLAERSDEQDQVTLSTLHASKGLEWPHVVLAGVNEGLLPFRSEDEETTPQHIEEERRLMYVGITRARRTLAVDVLRRRKKGREFVPGVPSRFIAEMKLDEVKEQVDPREKLKALRAAAAARASIAKPEEPETA
ncbi:ATP-dependent helicase [Piscinibacter gummiphilus]|uniref:ATP-dependent DNA helicase Rep n=1 Tax=Piscinibacter gummiphilus TaxID=946333 RepID=A0A1W6LG95_9BURK|nr:UvrD-helicase domain-containing protein [Piscinibacter gummiphilus]ARN23304.1 ATP-dependent DNA helicase Rep [Piscinibacter gummiphilus]ATU68005.1 ATP-dependent DNA helicase Rep [Piscinibacter gummiphilus]GLS97298.1 ATP-dependent DNA helicase Rep [Piscinibacter gummiphilus]